MYSRRLPWTPYSSGHMVVPGVLLMTCEMKHVEYYLAQCVLYMLIYFQGLRHMSYITCPYHVG